MNGENFRINYEYNLEKDGIDEGAFGKVFKAVHKETKEKRAIKLIDVKKLIKKFKNHLSEDEIKDFMNLLLKEINIMKEMEGKNHENENTVKVYEYYYQKDIEIAIVMELCDENLETMISNKFDKKENFTFDEIKNILKQLNNSFRIMEKNKIAHRDLKPENILVKYKNDKDKNNFIIKLCDYGGAKRLTITKNVFKTTVGTLPFMAPEIMEGQPFDLKCDLWSLGVIIYYLYFQKYPYPAAQTEFTLINYIKNHGQKFFQKSENEEFDDLIHLLLIKVPQERISWGDYFNHPFLKDNKILTTLKINVKDINKEVYFLNNKDDKKWKNEEIDNLNNEDCQIFINGEPKDFNKFFKPEKEGEYKIEIIFKKKLKNCSYMFANCEKVTKLDLSSFNTSQVTNMYYMFGRCYELKEINLSNIQTKNVTNMGYLFDKCKKLKNISLPDSFDTGCVENMEYMFHDCNSLEKIIFPPSFVTKKVKSMECMFFKCYNLEKLDLKNFETKEVTKIGYMFNSCSNLRKILIDPEKFKTDKVIEMGKMFYNCENLESVDIIKNFDYSNVKFMDQMFVDCKKIQEIDLSNLNINKDKLNTNNIFGNLKNIKVKVNEGSIDKFKKEFKDINFNLI